MQEAVAINSIKELHSFSWLLGTEVHAVQQAMQVPQHICSFIHFLDLKFKLGKSPPSKKKRGMKMNSTKHRRDQSPV